MGVIRTSRVSYAICRGECATMKDVSKDLIAGDTDRCKPISQTEEGMEDVDDDDAAAGGYEHFRITVDPGQSLLRVDKFLFHHLKETSRNRIQKAVDAGFVRVNDMPVKRSYKVKPKDIITVVLDHPCYDNSILPEEIPIDVVYEDEHLIVVDKPAGLVVHPGVGNHTGTLVNAVAWHLRGLPSFDINSPEVGLVHRIDKNTSGLLVLAKTPEAKTKLGLQFFHKTSRRRYKALVWGDFEKKEGRIEGNIARDPKDRLRMAVFSPGSSIGKPAVTHYKVLRRYGYTTLVECRLETGRTHQIRAHMRSIGHPLFNDERYGGSQILRGTTESSYRQFIHSCFDACPRVALHAETLGFKHPSTGEEMDFFAPLPTDMQRLINMWEEFTGQR